MTCYLQLTLADAERIIRENDRRYWAEARLLMSRASQFTGDEPDFYLMTFVRCVRLPDNHQVRASRGQCIVMMRSKLRAAFEWGAPLDGDEPLLRAMRLEHLKEKVGQPQASRKPMGGGVLPLFNQPKRKDRQ
jgi:hypothetical protein